MKYIIIVYIFAISISSAQWKQTNGPYGGEVTSFFENGNNIYACTNSIMYDASIYLTSDKGDNWKLVKKLPFNSDRSSLVFNDDTIFWGIRTLGKKLGANENDQVFGFYFSTDKGDSWEEKHIDSNTKGRIFFCTKNNGNIYVGTFINIFVSSDNGKSWQKPFNYNQNITFTNLYFFEDSVFAISNGIYQIINNGESTIEVGLIGKTINEIYYFDNILYAATSNGIFKSYDMGKKWLQTGLNSHAIFNFATSDSLIYAATNKGLYLSNNKGLSWEIIYSESVRNLLIQDNIIFIGTLSGILKSTDNGENWIYANSGINSLSLNSIIKYNDLIISTTFNNGLFSSIDNGKNWNDFNYPKEAKTLTQFLPFDNKFYCSSYEGIFVSNDGGNTWLEKNNGLPNKYILDIFNYEDKLFCTLIDNGVYTSNDGGEYWTKFHNDLSNYSIFSYYFENDNIYFGTNSLGIIYSSDKGKTWQISNKGFSSLNLVVRKIENINNKIFAATSIGLYNKGIGDDAWQIVHSNFENKSVTDIVLIDSTIIISYENLVMISKDYGRNWFDISQGLNENYISHLVKIDSNIFALTYNAGLFKISESEIDSLLSTFKTETQNYLYAYPPYPLPATKEVRSLINWDTSTDIENDEMTVYNIYGIKVAGKEKLRIDKLTNYSGNLVWDCSDVLSGIYIIYITHGSESRAIKVIVVK